MSKSFIGLETVGGPDFTPEGVLLLQDGSVSAPAQAWISDPATGLYKNGTSIGVSAGGSQVASFSPSGMTASALTAGDVSAGNMTASSLLVSAGGVLYIQPGSALTPSLSIDNATGLFRPATRTIGITAFGTELLRGNSSSGFTMSVPLTLSSNPLSCGALTTSDILTIPGGAASAPSLTFTGDTTTGLFRSGAITVGIASNGSQIARGSTSKWDFTTPLAMNGYPISGVGSLTSTGTMSCGTNSMTCGALASSSIAASGSINCGSNRLVCGDIAAGGTIGSSGSCAFGGVVSCPSITTGSVLCGPLNTQGGTISTGSATVAGLTSSGDVTCPRYKISNITSASQAILTSTDTIVSFDNTLDTSTNWPARTDPLAFTVPVAGLYNVTGNICMGAMGSGGTLEGFFTVNVSSTDGNTVKYGHEANNSVGRTAVAPSDQLQLAAGDTVRMFVRQGTGATINLGGSATIASRIAITRQSE